MIRRIITGALIAGVAGLASVAPATIASANTDWDPRPYAEYVGEDKKVEVDWEYVGEDKETHVDVQECEFSQEQNAGLLGLIPIQVGVALCDVNILSSEAESH